jgi:hypothetical protein
VCQLKIVSLTEDHGLSSVIRGFVNPEASITPDSTSLGTLLTPYSLHSLKHVPVQYVLYDLHRPLIRRLIASEIIQFSYFDS